MFLEITALKDPVRKKKSELLYVTLQNLRLMNKFEKRKPLIRGGSRGMMLYINVIIIVKFHREMKFNVFSILIDAF